MLAGGALWAKTKKRVRAIGKIGSDIPTRTPCLVCCVVKPLPTRQLSERWVEVEVTLTLIAIEEEHHVGVAAISLMDVELLLGHGAHVHDSRSESPNDPKLSDGRGWRGPCMAGGKAAAEAATVTRGTVRCSA